MDKTDSPRERGHKTWDTEPLAWSDVLDVVIDDLEENGCDGPADLGGYLAGNCRITFAFASGAYPEMTYVVEDDYGTVILVELERKDGEIHVNDARGTTRKQLATELWLCMRDGYGQIELTDPRRHHLSSGDVIEATARLVEHIGLNTPITNAKLASALETPTANGGNRVLVDDASAILRSALIAAFEGQAVASKRSRPTRRRVAQ